MKIIETYYNGNRFRSRLEARWAVFLDAVGLGFRYEQEGFDLYGVWYLPDFWLPALDCWLEIKPVVPMKPEQDKARRLAQASGKRVYVLFGALRAPLGGWTGADEPEHAEAICFFPDGVEDRPYFWCQCVRCDFVGLEWEGRSHRLRCGCWGPSDRGENVGSRMLLEAYEQARTMRFVR